MQNATKFLGALDFDINKNEKLLIRHKRRL